MTVFARIRPKSSARGLKAFVAAVCLIILGLEGWRDWSEREQEIAEISADAMNLARSLVQHAQDSFEVADALLADAVERVETGFAWAEEPPSRLRHFITNIRAGEVRETPSGEESDVRSNLLLFRSRWDDPEHVVLSAERRDVLRRVDGEWKLAKRVVILDSATLPTMNISFFF